MVVFLRTLLAAALLIEGCALKEEQAADNLEVRQLMNEHSQDAKICFDLAVERNPSIVGGQIKIRADQDTNGRFQDIRLIDGFPGSGPIFECLQKKIAAWTSKPFLTNGSTDFVWTFRDRMQLFSSQEIQNTMKAHENDFVECYDQAARTTKDLGNGKVQFEFLVRPDGEVTHFHQLAGFRGSQQITECLKPKAAEWKFPPKEGPSTLKWAFNFYGKN